MRSVVITACTGRKRLPPAQGLRARDLGAGALEDVAQDWVDRLHAANGRVPASRLYCGRGFSESVSAAQAIRAPLFIVSAGVGLIPAQIAVPSYGLTITPGSPDSILRRIQPSSSASAWWAQLAARSTRSGGGSTPSRSPGRAGPPSGGCFAECGATYAAASTGIRVRDCFPTYTPPIPRVT